MRIAYISDIHTDAGHLGRTAARLLPGLVQDVAPDVFIIGGDVASALHTVDHFLAHFSGLTCPRLFVPGNHDIWVSHADEKGFSSWDKYNKLLPDLCRKNGFHFLPGEPLVIDRIGFAGTIGWYDYSFRNPDLDDMIPPNVYRRKHYKGKVWNDRRYALWNQPDEEVSDEMADQLDTDISILDGRCERIAAVTHHLPFVELVRRSSDPEKDFFTAFLGSRRLGDIILKHHKVSLALSGHTHYRLERTVSGVRAITSPLGYDRERHEEPEQAVKESLLVIEL